MGLRQFLTIENAFYFILKALFVLEILFVFFLKKDLYNVKASGHDLSFNIV